MVKDFHRGDDVVGEVYSILNDRVCPLLWFMGACCCAGRRNPYESFWGKANAVMGVLFILSSILYSMVAVTVDDWSVGLRLFYTFSTA